MKMTRYRPILMQSDRWIEEVDFRSETKSGFLFQLKKKKFSMQTFSIEQSDPRIPSKLPVEKLDLEKLDFFDGMRRSGCSIGDVFQGPAHLSSPHKTHDHTTQQPTTAPILA